MTGRRAPLPILNFAIKCCYVKFGGNANLVLVCFVIPEVLCAREL